MRAFGCCTYIQSTYCDKCSTRKKRHKKNLAKAKSTLEGMLKGVGEAIQGCKFKSRSSESCGGSPLSASRVNRWLKAFRWLLCYVITFGARNLKHSRRAVVSTGQQLQERTTTERAV